MEKPIARSSRPRECFQSRSNNRKRVEFSCRTFRDSPIAIEDHPMRSVFQSLLLAAAIVLAAKGSSFAYLSTESPLCGNWERECARLWRSGTKHYRQCMGQPQAIRDCATDIFSGPANLCDNWLKGCAQLYGANTRAYRACMRQPQARVDCGR